MLIVFGGLPGVGKTSIAKELARQIGAVHLRIDTIEHALASSAILSGPMNDAGYRVAYALAEDNLRLGRTVIADSVNPLDITRDAWLAVAERAKAPALEVEIVCSDPAEHRRRVERRSADIEGFRLPTWAEVESREYHEWSREHLRIDTATLDLDQSVARIQEALSQINC